MAFTRSVLLLASSIVVAEPTDRNVSLVTVGGAANNLVVVIEKLTAPMILSRSLLLVGVLEILILVFDRALWLIAPIHVYGLVVFVAGDFVVAGFVSARPRKTAFTLAAVWGAVRIIIQMGDVLLAPMLGLTYAEFVGYLFNPLVGNPANPRESARCV